LGGADNHAVDLVLLDAGGVLLLPDADHIQRILRRAGVHADISTIDRAHYAAMAAVDEALARIPVGAGGVTSAIWESSLRQAYRIEKLRGLGLPDDVPPDLEAEIFNASWARVVPGAVDTLRLIASQEVPIGIVSNANGTIEAELKAFEICQVGAGAGTCVIAVVDSTVVGVAKPDPAIFRVALEAAGAPAERAIFIGDSVSIDVEGATRAGVRGLHFDPFGLCDGAGHDDLRALPEIASRIR
jgi:putative hydrolase of the HAD superfamily